MPRNLLTQSQVLEIKRLRLEERMGAYRIADLVGLPMWQVKNVIEGTAYAYWTGGPIRLPRREDSRWRGGSRSFMDYLMEEV